MPRRDELRRRMRGLWGRSAELRDQVAARLRGPGRGSLVSVVVLPEQSSRRPGDPPAARLAGILASGHRAVEVLVPADAGRWWIRRVRRLRSGATPDDAVAAARGEFLAFVRAGDRWSNEGLAAMVTALERSGSGAAVAAQGPERLGVEAAEQPDLLTDLSPAGKLFRTTAWRACAVPVPSWAGAAEAVAAALLSGPVDTVPTRLHPPPAKEDPRPLAERPDLRPDLAAERCRTLRAAGERIAAADADTYDAWLAAVLDRVLLGWSADAVGGAEGYLAELAPLTRRLLADLRPGTAERVRVEARVSAWIVAHHGLEQVAAWHSHLLDSRFGLPHHAGLVDIPDGVATPPDSLRALTAADRRPRLWLGDVVVTADGAHLHGRCFTEYADPAGQPQVRLRGREARVIPHPDPAANAWAARAFEDRSDCGFLATWPALPPGAGPFEVEVAFDGHVLTATAGVRPDPPPDAAQVTAAELDEDRLVLRATTGVVPGHRDATLEVPLTQTVFGRSVLLRAGRHEVRELADGSPAPPVALPAAWAEQPPHLAGPRLSVRPESPGGRLRVVVGAPLSMDERSAFRQEQWRASVYAAVARPTYDRTVLFESFRGRAVSDNPLAIARELLSRDTTLDLAFVVDDPSVFVPEGLRAVPRRTREWYDLLARARFLVTNAGGPGFYHKKPGQVHVQTWHGTPLKRIGEDRGPGDLLTWRHRRMIARQAAGWDALVSPSPYCTQIFRSAFAFDGNVLEVGHPRNDVLVSAGADAVRQRTRSRLGLDDSELAVLYAPTWREYAGVRDAKPLYLDADLVTRSVPGSVVLVRGHYNATGQREVYAGHERVRDVTRYPDIADLFLAADVLVTDYSSVMFDFVLTDKPVVLLTPDLDRYRDVERGFYFDLESEGPGPLVSTTRQVVRLLRDLDASTARHSAARRRFRSRFCPLDDGGSAARVVDSCILSSRPSAPQTSHEGTPVR